MLYVTKTKIVKCDQNRNSYMW